MILWPQRTCQAPLSMGFSRQEYWRGLPFPSPGDLPDPGIKPKSPASQAESLPTELWEKPLSYTCFVFPFTLFYRVIFFCTASFTIRHGNVFLYLLTYIFTHYWTVGSFVLSILYIHPRRQSVFKINSSNVWKNFAFKLGNTWSVGQKPECETWISNHRCHRRYLEYYRNV